MAARFLAAVPLFLAAACGSPASAPPLTGTTSSVSAAPSAPPVKAAAPAVLVARDGITFDGVRVVPIKDDPSLGADAEHKRSGPNDLYLPPLAGALSKAQTDGLLERGTADRKAELHVVIEPDVPYRLVIETLFTAGQTELGRFVLQEGVGGKRTTVTEPPNAYRLAPVDPNAPPLNLSVIVLQTGISIKTGMGNVAPGCRDVGAGVAIPKVDGKLDFEALAACVTSIKTREVRFADEQTYLLTAIPNVPFSDVMSVIEVMRGAPAFRTVHFGIAK
jgi:hypothetical protein